MTKLQRILFRTGAVACLLTAALHLVGHLAGQPPPRNETEAELRKLMTEYRADVLGVPLTMQDLVSGFSLCYSLFLAWVGLVALLLVRRAGPERFMRSVAVLCALGAVALLAVSYRYFPLPPTICAAVIVLGFAGATIPGGKAPA
ncbi:MAG TPA: hypothetical protein VIC87_13225 [Vicinamibacteria bacterium]